MKTNILEFLEETTLKYPEKTAFSNGEYGITFSEFTERAKNVGTFLAGKGYYNEPVVVFMGKHPDTINAFMGVIYSGCFYIPMDSEMPRHRIDLIFQNLKPRAIICAEDTRDTVDGLWPDAVLYDYAEISKTPADETVLADIRARQIDTDAISEILRNI